ncbi:TRAP-type C4-dicarboxylate transport system permease small subunit OS=Ureibacillus acetophenoni OX=614649 GN=SAMN05877842_107133 PE=3 SV=1 [Ureibacillus acetophenoni]
MWRKTIDTINLITKVVAMLCVVAMVLVVFMQIVSRNLFSYSFPWVEELSKYLMIAVIFLGAGIGVQYGSHINIDVLFNRLSNKVKKYMQIMISILSIIFLMILLIYGIDVSNRTMVQSSTSLGIPMGVFYYVIPIGAALFIINIIDYTISSLKTGDYSREEP